MVSKFFFDTQEKERGLDFLEDLAAPGDLVWQLDSQNREALLTIQAAGFSEPGPNSLEDWVAQLRVSESTRAPDPEDRIPLNAPPNPISFVVEPAKA